MTIPLHANTPFFVYLGETYQVKKMEHRNRHFFMMVPGTKIFMFPHRTTIFRHASFRTKHSYSLCSYMKKKSFFLHGCVLKSNLQQNCKSEKQEKYLNWVLTGLKTMVFLIIIFLRTKKKLRILQKRKSMKGTLLTFLFLAKRENRTVKYRFWDFVFARSQPQFFKNTDYFLIRMNILDRKLSFAQKVKWTLKIKKYRKCRSSEHNKSPDSGSQIFNVLFSHKQRNSFFERSETEVLNFFCFTELEEKNRLGSQIIKNASEQKNLQIQVSIFVVFCSAIHKELTFERSGACFYQPYF